MIVVYAALTVLAGMISWSLMEYLIHRFLGHKHRNNPFAGEHLRHHAEGNYFAPPWKKVGAAVLVVGLAAPLASLLVGPALGTLYAVSFTSTYLTYELFHLRAHTHAGSTAYGRWLRRHHFAHHFHGAAYNHGVTSSVWDHVFGTYKAPPAVIRVPAKLAMVWLLDPSSGEVHAHLTEGWALRGQRRAA